MFIYNEVVNLTLTSGVSGLIDQIDHLQLTCIPGLISAITEWTNHVVISGIFTSFADEMEFEWSLRPS